MALTFLFKGMLMGLLGSIPLGPIGVLCIQRTLSKKFRSGFFSGLGAATADSLFAVVAIFFLSLVMSFIESRKELLTAVGGVIIMAIGIMISLKKPSLYVRRNRARSKNVFRDYISTFLLTLTNPAYILVFVALFATVGIEKESLSAGTAVLTILGVFSGASVWWFILTFFINKIRRRFRPRHVVIISRIAGSVIILLGVLAVIGAFVKMPAGWAV